MRKLIHRELQWPSVSITVSVRGNSGPKAPSNPLTHNSSRAASCSGQAPRDAPVHVRTPTAHRAPLQPSVSSSLSSPPSGTSPAFLLQGTPMACPFVGSCVDQTPEYRVLHESPRRLLIWGAPRQSSNFKDLLHEHLHSWQQPSV